MQVYTHHHANRLRLMFDKECQKARPIRILLRVDLPVPNHTQTPGDLLCTRPILHITRNPKLSSAIESTRKKQREWYLEPKCSHGTVRVCFQKRPQLVHDKSLATLCANNSATTEPLRETLHTTRYFSRHRQQIQHAGATEN